MMETGAGRTVAMGSRPAWADATRPGALSGGIPQLGPQAERSSEWVNRDGEVQPPTEREVGDMLLLLIASC